MEYSDSQKTLRTLLVTPPLKIITTLASARGKYLVFDLHINKIRWHTPLYVWLLLLNIMSVRSIHVYSNLCFLLLYSIPLYKYATIILLPMGIWFGTISRFDLLWMKLQGDIPVPVFSCAHVHISLGHLTRHTTVEFWTTLNFTLAITFQLSKVIPPIPLLPTVSAGSGCSSLWLWFWQFLILSFWEAIVSHCCFHLHFPGD